jgi:hypothetical protein
VEDLNDFVKRFIGNLCYVSRMPEGLDGQICIGVWDDEVVIDSITNAPRLHVIGQPDLFRGYFEETDSGLNVVFPSRLEMAEDINRSRKRVTERSEGSLLESIGSKILRIPLVMNQIHPITMILDSVLNTSSVSLSDFKRSDNIRRYIDFMSDLDIIMLENKSIVPGRFMVMKMSGDMEEDELYSALLSRVVDKGLLRMFTELHITHLRPFIRMANANCMTSHIEDTPLKWDWTVFGQYLKKIYSEHPKKSDIASNAMQLKRARIMDTEKKVSGGDTLFFCEGEIFARYSERFDMRISYA